MRAALMVGLAALAGCGKGKTTGDEPGAPRELVTELEPVDAARTVRWVGKVWDDSRTVIKPGNALTVQQADEKFRSSLATTVGKRVRWSLPVERVETDGTLRITTVEWQRNEGDDALRRYLLIVADAGQNPRNTHDGIVLRPDGEGWASQLARGDRVLVTGEVTGWADETFTFGEKGKPGLAVVAVVRLADVRVTKP